MEVLADLDQSGVDGETKCVDPFDLTSPLILEPQAHHRSSSDMHGHHHPSSLPPPHNDNLLSPEALASAEAADSTQRHGASSSAAAAATATKAAATHHGSPGAWQSFLSNEEASTQFGGSQLEGGSTHGSMERFSEGSGYAAGGGGGSYSPIPADFARIRRTDPGVVSTPWIAAGSAIDHNENSCVDQTSRVSVRAGGSSSESGGNHSSGLSFMHESQYGGTLLLSPGQGAHVHTTSSRRNNNKDLVVGNESQPGRHPSDSQARQLRRRRRQYRRRSSVAAAVARTSGKVTNRHPLPRLESTGRVNSSPRAEDNDASNQRMLTLAALVATTTSPEVDWTGCMIAAASGLFLGVQVRLIACDEERVICTCVLFIINFL